MNWPVTKLSHILSDSSVSFSRCGDQTEMRRSLSPPSGDSPELKIWVLSVVPVSRFLTLSLSPVSSMHNQHLQGWERRLRLSFSLVISSFVKAESWQKITELGTTARPTVRPSMHPTARPGQSLHRCVHAACRVSTRKPSQAVLVGQPDHPGTPTSSSGTVLQCPTSSWVFSETKPHSQQLLINNSKKESFSCTAYWNLSFLKKKNLNIL